MAGYFAPVLAGKYERYKLEVSTRPGEVQSLPIAALI